ncbi:kinase-like domain-containing protein [Auriculariales sp. MPI-PUGE-AT-0066]|nr:kinase-like domain-containing protein [Auriculariales sp. MPI-PUGE-AT-0066]
MNLSDTPFESATTAIEHGHGANLSDPKLAPTPHPSLLFSQSQPRPPPANPTGLLAPFASGACSELFKCVVKKPEVIQVEINGELQSNALDVTQQFVAEMLVYNTISRHRNIVTFLGCLEGVGMVLEFVEGQALFDVIRQRPQLSKSIKVDFHNQLLDGITHLHSYGFSHGDLSLLNVIVNESHTLKIFDFGRSISVHDPQQPPEPSGSSSTLENRPILIPQIHPGTRPFTAPEILRGECRDGRLADAYSIEVRNQKKDILPNLSGLEVFEDQILPYLEKCDVRRRLAKEQRMKVPKDQA